MYLRQSKINYPSLSTQQQEHTPTSKNNVELTYIDEKKLNKNLLKPLQAPP